MEVVEFDGKQYVKASDAAKRTGYTSDYIGQLCRSKAVSARMVGRSWYVDLEELDEHRAMKKRTSRSKAREQVQKAVEERQHEAPEQRPYAEPINYLNYVRYAEDDSELVPMVHRQTEEPEPEEEKVDDTYTAVPVAKAEPEPHTLEGEEESYEDEDEERDDVAETDDGSASVPLTVSHTRSERPSRSRAPRQRRKIEQRAALEEYPEEEMVESRESVPVTRTIAYGAMLAAVFVVGLVAFLSVEKEWQYAQGDPLSNRGSVTTSHALDVGGMLKKYLKI